MSDQIITGACLAGQGIYIGQKVARTARNIRFDTYYSAKTIEGLGAGSAWIFSGLVLAAYTGWDYRKLKRNEITEEQFYHNIRTNTASTIGSVIGCTIGIAIGVPIGEYCYNNIGAIFGAVAGGLTGAVFGEATGLRIEDSLE